MSDQPTRHELEQRRIATLERCAICDRPSGDETHIDQCDGCLAMCWGRQTDSCRAHAVDWRARALAAEARVAALTDAAQSVLRAYNGDDSMSFAINCISLALDSGSSAAPLVDWRLIALDLTMAARELIDAMDRDVRRDDDYWGRVFNAKRDLRGKLEDKP